MREPVRRALDEPAFQEHLPRHSDLLCSECVKEPNEQHLNAANEHVNIHRNNVQILMLCDLLFLLPAKGQQHPSNCNEKSPARKVEHTFANACHATWCQPRDNTTNARPHEANEIPLHHCSSPPNRAC